MGITLKPDGQEAPCQENPPVVPAWEEALRAPGVLVPEEMETNGLHTPAAAAGIPVAITVEVRTDLVQIPRPAT